MTGPIVSIAAKELRALFQSQVAVLFLALFLISSNLTFFVLSRFFARGIADLVPLFEWLPVLLIVLVSAVAMRAWAEERKSGTLEVLMTLPVTTAQLVLGKFAAGMALVAIALSTTVPLALTVSFVGPLDWGPVLGGYLGAALLGSSYLAIGLCVSARTDNQVVALMGTAVIGGLLYLVGSEPVRALLGASNGELAALIGTGSRFDSIARGVVDARDVAYYASLTGFFLVLNVYFLDRRRVDPHGDGRARLTRMQALLALAGANALALNLWLAPVRVARVDLTENQDYTISDVTRGVLAELDEPLRIQGVFSERSHPKLQPLAPQLAALLEEYAVVGGRNVTTELLDPSGDDDLADLLEQEFGIRPVPMPTADRNETRIVNSWFHVLLRYGDKHAVVGFSDLAEVDATDGNLRVKLRDPEYDITKAIRRVTQDFASTESLVEQLPQGSRLLLYVTEGALDATGQANLATMREVASEVAAISDTLTFEELDPTTDPAMAEQIAATYGVQPALSLETMSGYYLHLVLDAGGRAQRVFPRGQLSRRDLEKTLDAAFQRVVPGQLKTVAFFTEVPLAPTPQPGRRPEPARERDYRYLEQLLETRFESAGNLDLRDGFVPDTVDVLIVAKTGPITPKQQLAIDQFLLRGGAVIALASRDRIEYGPRGFEAIDQGETLFEQLARYGVEVGRGHLLDMQSSDLAMPVGGRMVQFQYPHWLDVRPSQIADGHVAANGIPHLSMPWPSVVDLGALPDGVTGEVLLRTSPSAWVSDTVELLPDFVRYPAGGFEGPTTPQTHPLAVTLTGRFPSFFDEDSRPDVPGALTEPVAEGKLVVIGSTEFVGDVILEYAGGQMGRAHANNPLLVNNLIDWALEDTDLLSIRNAGSFDRALDPIEAELAQQLELTNYGFGGAVLAAFFVVARRRPAIPSFPRSDA